DRADKRRQRPLVVVACACRTAHHVERARVRFRRIDVTVKAEPRRGQREHTPKLTAAENADRRADLERTRAHVLVSLGRFATLLVCFARQASSRLASFGSDSASTAAASKAALIAPAFPIASVPTGTPAGICMMESSESLPSSACVF